MANAMTDPEAALRETLSDDVCRNIMRSAIWRADHDGVPQVEMLRREIIAAVAPLLTPRAWQPMETCPDGATVLTKMKHGVIEGTWNQAEGVCEGYYFMNITWFPEAWMPLPPAPKERQG